MSAARRRRSNSAARIVLAIAASFALPSCLQVETFFFAGRSIDEYRWDEASPELDGDLGEAHASIIGAADREEGFVTLDDGTRIHFVFAHRDGATTTILYSHGNGPHLGQFWDRIERLWSLGFHVVVYDYPGFGRSEGTSSERGLYDAVTAVWEQTLPTLRDVDRGSVVLYGQSLGAGPTLHLAARTRRDVVAPRAVVVESAWCSIESQIQEGAFLDLPRELLAHLSIDNCARAAEVDGSLPILIVHGTEDATSSPRQAMFLARAGGPSVTLRWAVGARHADVPVVAGDAYDEWIREHAALAR